MTTLLDWNEPATLAQRQAGIRRRLPPVARPEPISGWPPQCEGKGIDGSACYGVRGYCQWHRG